VTAAKLIELRDVVAFQNIPIDGDAVIDNERVWRIVEDDLPRLQTALTNLLATG
jgi:uncharacterized protein with HEPN domain